MILATPTKPPVPVAEAMPAMVSLDSPEFHAAVRAAMAAASANIPGTTVQAEAGLVARTSIDTTQSGLDDLTVRFNRFCTVQGCGYQRGQEAGFPWHIAEQIAASQSGVIVHDPRRNR